jgi:hypothetical protein
MKTETKKEIKEKEFDTVKTFRAIKDKISIELVEMDLNQIQAYLQSKKVRLQD